MGTRTAGAGTRAGLVFWLVGLVFWPPAAPAAPRYGVRAGRGVAYRTYVNARFGYAVAYPVGVLAPQGEPDNGDGQRFTSARGEAVLTVFGRYNALGETLKGLYHDALRAGPGRVVTGRSLGRDRFVVSGRGQGRSFTEETIMDGDVILSLAFVSPERRRAFYAPVAARVAGSLRRLRQG